MEQDTTRWRLALASQSASLRASMEHKHRLKYNFKSQSASLRASMELFCKGKQLAL